ncbi:MAG: hypothetical protein CMN31_10905, partial [Sandaracinus sp.]|nr:hypothetical protein [Sandaracinus sp.]
EALGEEEGETPRHAAELLLVLRDTARLGAAVTVLARDVLGPNAIAALREWGAEASAPLRAVADAATGPTRALALELAAELATAPDATLRAWLWEAAEDEAPAVAAAALRSLGRFAQAEDAPALVRRASAPGGDLAANAEPAAAATEALRRLAEREAASVEAALAAVDLGHAGPRLPALLAELGGEGALDALQAGLSSEDPALRQACLDALGALGDGRGSDVIAFALMDEDAAVRREAVRALGRVRPLGARAAEGLRQALEDGAPAVRAEAAAALGAHGDGADVPLLGALLEDQPAVAVAAMDALIALAPPDLEAHVERALAHADAEVVKRGLAAARRLPAAAAATRLGAGLAHGSWHVRAAAARLLGELGSGAATAALEARRAVEEDELVREALDAALAEGGRAGG